MACTCRLRGARKQQRKRYGRYDSRGRLAGKRHDQRTTRGGGRLDGKQGHWEIDTVMGNTSACVVTLVERQSGYLLVGKMQRPLYGRTQPGDLRADVPPPRSQFRTITADNGTEFHD